MQVDTPFGPAWATINADGALTAFSFRTSASESQGFWNAEVARQLSEFFAGQRREFDLPLAPAGTAFQKRVWTNPLKIPFGETISYGVLASRVGNPNASRAVGGANGSNPIALVIPCHRVIGANGKLTGYGGGLELKEKLLVWERSFIAPRLFE